MVSIRPLCLCSPQFSENTPSRGNSHVEEEYGAAKALQHEKAYRLSVQLSVKAGAIEAIVLYTRASAETHTNLINPSMPYK